MSAQSFILARPDTWQDHVLKTSEGSRKVDPTHMAYCRLCRAIDLEVQRANRPTGHEMTLTYDLTNCERVPTLDPTARLIRGLTLQGARP